MKLEPFDQSIIVADNDSSMRGLLRSMLDHPRRAIYLAADGDEAVEYARYINADLVLLDMRMPRMDGLEACTRIRALPQYNHVPIVLLTAFDSSLARRKASQSGVSAFFTKPISAESLRRSLAPLFAIRQSHASRPAS